MSQGLAPNLPPSVQAKQVAQAALRENFTITQVHKILSESPKFKEISSVQGLKKAQQFADITLAAAERQNAIGSQCKQQEQQNNKQIQAY